LLNKLPVPVPLFTQNEQLFTQGKFLQDWPPRQFYLISTKFLEGNLPMSLFKKPQQPQSET